jgi:hypothetical protein
MRHPVLFYFFGCWLLLVGLARPAQAQQAPRRAPQNTKAATSPTKSTAPAATSVRPAYQQRILKGRVSRRLRVRADGTPEFPNINKIAFYEDKKALKAIQKAERRHNYAEARKLLTRYVSQFGIDNFYRNTDLLWHLGQLMQRDSTKQELAKAYFRLALKHHRTDIRRVQLYYDSLEEKAAILYVPLKHLSPAQKRVHQHGRRRKLEVSGLRPGPGRQRYHAVIQLKAHPGKRNAG